MLPSAAMKVAFAEVGRFLARQAVALLFPGSCAGCDVPTCIVLNSIQLFQPPDANFDPVITNPQYRNFVAWQRSVRAAMVATTPSIRSARANAAGRSMLRRSQQIHRRSTR